MAWAGDGAEQLAAVLESEGSEEEEEEEEEEDEEAAMAQQHPTLGQEADEAEERLAELEQASQALLAELSALETEFEIERTCRQRAEAYAAQVKQENRQLKQLSLARPESEPPEEDPDPAQRYGQQLEDLQEKISWLLAQRKDLTVQVQELQRQNQDLQDQLEMGQGERQRLRAALGTSQRTPGVARTPRSGAGPPPEPPLSPAVSQIVTQDYCEAVQRLELEQDLRLHAEAFAHEVWPGPGCRGGTQAPTGGGRAEGGAVCSQRKHPDTHPAAEIPRGRGCSRAPVTVPRHPRGEMLVQKNEANRQSTILLQGGGPSAQLLAALQEVGRLSRALEEARRQQQQRVRSRCPRGRVTWLGGSRAGARHGSGAGVREPAAGRIRPLPARPTLRAQPAEVKALEEQLELARAALAAAEDEKLQLKKRLQEAEGRLAGLEEEVGLLQEKLARDPPPQSRTPEPAAPEPPPPPPPLPPPAPTVPVDPLLAIRQRKGLANARRTKPDADDAKARAVQEMMERIKNGVVLRPAKERVPPHQRRSAVLELQGILVSSPVPRCREEGEQEVQGSAKQPEGQGRAAGVHPAAAAAGGDKDVGTAPARRSPGSEEGVPFRPRAAGGLPRTRPLARLARGRGEPG
ncbi:shootin-1-like [Mycteria americana]|uniref:shootin-1-like n=1 Tax=Mycteria americana TaxID=33587 RepID=UPI003F58B86C